MGISSLILDIDDFLVMKGKIVDKILLSSNPDVALLYLYISRKKNEYSEKKALNELNFSKERLEIAMFELLSLNVFKSEEKQNEQKTYFEKKPTYTITELKTAKTDPVFVVVCESTEKILGKTLTESYMKTLLYLYDALKMSPEVIIELISYLKNNQNTSPTKTEIEREARVWQDIGINNHADAINYITTKYEQKPMISKMAEALSISGRAISKQEEHYIVNFIKLGYSPDVIEFLSTTIMDSNGKFSKKHLFNKVLQLKEKNLITKAEILSEYPNLDKSIKKSDDNYTNEYKLEPWELRALNRRKGGNDE